MLFRDFDISGGRATIKAPIFAGHMILNTVDCTRPNGGKLPHGVDLMMSDFAGGASGFPMTFYGGKYSGKFFLYKSAPTRCFSLLKVFFFSDTFACFTVRP